MKARLSCAVVAAFVLTSLVDVTPAAAGDRTLEDAAAEYERGLQAARAGRHLEAGAAFMEAFGADPNPSLLWNAARSYDAGGDIQRARALYERYITQPEAGPDKVSRARRWLEQHPGPATEGAAGDPRVTVLEAAGTDSGSPALGWTLCGLGIAATVGASITMAMASQSRDATYALTWDRGYDETLAKHERLTQEAQDRELAAWMTYGLATALVSSGLVLLLSGGSDEQARTEPGPVLGLIPGRRGLSASATWRF
ncbi:MAG: hypothetical protein QF464_06920 [Myxococcota bacterium]|jgi:tetratricopeptide (TPR) repeat protein|nr:hypothetical protein [Myxococcota bacterium]